MRPLEDFLNEAAGAFMIFQVLILIEMEENKKMKRNRKKIVKLLPSFVLNPEGSMAINFLIKFYTSVDFFYSNIVMVHHQRYFYYFRRKNREDIWGNPLNYMRRPK